jgi:hypothetical protein
MLGKLRSRRGDPFFCPAARFAAAPMQIGLARLLHGDTAYIKEQPFSRSEKADPLSRFSFKAF